MFSYARVFSLMFSFWALVNGISTSRMQNSPTQSLLSVVNGILDESIERKSYEIPHVCNRRIYSGITSCIEYVSVSMYLCNCNLYVRACMYLHFYHSFCCTACGLSVEKSCTRDWTTYINSSRALENCKNHFGFLNFELFLLGLTVPMATSLCFSVFSKIIYSKLVRRSISQGSEFLKPLLLGLVKKEGYGKKNLFQTIWVV